MLTAEQRYERKKRQSREYGRRMSAAAREIVRDFPAATTSARSRRANNPSFGFDFVIRSPLVGEILRSALAGEYGCVALAGPTKAAAARVLQMVRNELEHNDKLAGAFPEVCYPIRKLQGIPQRRLLYRGEPVGLELKPDLIRLPTRPASRAAGVCIVAIKIGQRVEYCQAGRPTLEIEIDNQAGEFEEITTT